MLDLVEIDMTKVYAPQDVFTPSSPARNTFVERDAVNARLVSALVTPGKQIVVYGHSGVGKTTLLENKLEQLYSKHFVTRCSKGLKFEQIMKFAFDVVDGYFVSEISKKKGRTISTKVAAEYKILKGEFGISKNTEESEKQERIVSPQVNAQNLAKLIGLAGGCWVLEDFHKIDESEKESMAQVMKVFMDMSRDYNSVRTIAIGAVGTAHEVVKYDKELKERVAEILVPPMTKEEMIEIIKKGEVLLNVKFSENLIERIIEYSNGVAAVCHQLCLYMCFNAGITETCNETHSFNVHDFTKALQSYLDGCSDTIKTIFDKAFRRKKVVKFDNPRIIIGAMVELGWKKSSYNSIYQQICKMRPDYPSGNLTLYLNQLGDDDHGSVIMYDQNSGLYSFAQPMYFAFAKAFFDLEKEKELEHRRNHLKTMVENGEFVVLLNKAMERISNQLLDVFNETPKGAKLQKGSKGDGEAV